MYTRAQITAALQLVRQSESLAAAARSTGINRSTLRRWSSDPSQRQRDPENPRAVDLIRSSRDYAYVLGLYLGDGCLSPHPRGVYRLRIVLDLAYPAIIDECRRAIAALVPPGNSVALVRKPSRCVEVSSYWRHWVRLLPQHGPGRKHDRTIWLHDWQHTIVMRHGQQLLRGLFHSDGCRSMNTIRSSTGKVYAYPRYAFVNRSADIRGIFTDALDQMGVHWTRTNQRTIAVSRRQDVATLDGFLGPKS